MAEVSDLMLKRVIDAVHQGGKDGLVSLILEDHQAVELALSHLCRHEYLFHRVCLLGDDELAAFLAGGSYSVFINTESPLV